MILKRFYFIGFSMLILMISCKDNQPKINYESEEYFYDSIQNKKVFVSDLDDFQEFKNQNPKQFQAISFFATYNKKSLKSANLVDSIMNDLGSKSKHIYASLDFYSGAKQKVLGFEHSKNSDLILIYEPNVHQWYKKINEN